LDRELASGLDEEEGGRRRRKKRWIRWKRRFIEGGAVYNTRASVVSTSSGTY
jgi:hypothetical protein